MKKNVAPKIREIISTRRKQLPLVQNEKQKWQDMSSSLKDLRSALTRLIEHPAETDVIEEVLRAFPYHQLLQSIDEHVVLLTTMENRFSRTTINIGVSGQARVGKSTLLQSITGLSDEQIPTGEGLPVTAVRSRIYNSKVHNRATLSLHGLRSFRDGVLVPYHRELGLTEPPLTAEQFAAWKYPESIEELDENRRERASSSSLLQRLLHMQKAFPHYQHLLKNCEEVVDLSELRQYIAYPTNESLKEGDCSRLYLAVKDVKIECPFPYVDVEELGLIDLPGLGELAADAERHHVQGLENDVDLVVLMKRPTKAAAFWDQKDAATLDLLTQARGAVRKPGDFVLILVNGGAVKESLIDGLLDDIRRQINENEDGRFYTVLTCDAADARMVYEKLMSPLLEHCAETMPKMDSDILLSASDKAHQTATAISNALTDIKTAIAKHIHILPGAHEELHKKAIEVRENIAQSLQAMVIELFHEARVQSEDDGSQEEGFVASARKAYDDSTAWIQDGFGEGKEAWCKRALSKMQTQKNSTPFAANELNSIRVKISHAYSNLDHYFERQINALWDRIAQSLKDHLGSLLDGVEGKEALLLLIKLFEEASEPCLTLKQSLEDLASLSIQYRTHLHPRVRRALDMLNLEILDQKTGKPFVQDLVVSIDREGAEELFFRISQLAEQAAYEAYKELLKVEDLTRLILHAAAEQFEDAFIRSEESEYQFHRLARSYRDEIWPGLFSGIDAANARVSKAKRAIAETVKKTEALRS